MACMVYIYSGTGCTDTVTFVVVSGDKGSRRELQTPRSHGLPNCPLSSHDGLLAEGQKQPTKI